MGKTTEGGVKLAVVLINISLLIVTSISVGRMLGAEWGWITFAALAYLKN